MEEERTGGMKCPSCDDQMIGLVDLREGAVLSYTCKNCGWTESEDMRTDTTRVD